MVEIVAFFFGTGLTFFLLAGMNRIWCGAFFFTLFKINKISVDLHKEFGKKVISNGAFSVFDDIDDPHSLDFFERNQLLVDFTEKLLPELTNFFSLGHLFYYPGQLRKCGPTFAYMIKSDNLLEELKKTKPSKPVKMVFEAILPIINSCSQEWKKIEPQLIEFFTTIDDKSHVLDTLCKTMRFLCDKAELCSECSHESPDPDKSCQFYQKKQSFSCFEKIPPVSLTELFSEDEVAPTEQLEEEKPKHKKRQQLSQYVPPISKKRKFK